MTETSYRYSHQAPGQGLRYDELLFGEGRYSAEVWKLEQRLLREILQRHFPHGLESYLDFACGTGRLLAFVAPFARCATGVDVSEDMIQRAREKAPSATLLVGDPTLEADLLAGREPFDCVTAFRFFLNAEPPLRAAALRVLHARMKEGGVLICNNHGNEQSLLALVRTIKRALRRPLPSALPFDELRALIESCGFVLCEIHGVCFLPMGVCRFLPPFLWTRIEQALGRLGKLGRYAINQIYVAQKVPAAGAKA